MNKELEALRKLRDLVENLTRIDYVKIEKFKRLGLEIERIG